MPVIETQKLSKNFTIYIKKPGLAGSLASLFKRDYKTKRAVKNFDFCVEEGEILGLLGPNGAGKTTLMKMLTGIIVPSSGQARVLGYAPHQRNKEFRKKIALVMGQKSQLWWDIPAMDSFLLLQKYYEISDRDFEQRLETWARALNVKDQLQTHVKKLSLGERMKMELMASLLHSPEVIFLDEPTIGLDLLAQENIRKFIKDYQKSSQASIILTSHYMADVHALCSRIVLILGGAKSYDGPIGDFETILGEGKQVSFSFRSPQDSTGPIWQDYHPEWSEDKTRVSLQIPMEDLKSVAIKILQDYPVVDFQTEKMPIEKVMKALFSHPRTLE